MNLKLIRAAIEEQAFVGSSDRRLEILNSLNSLTKRELLNLTEDAFQENHPALQLFSGFGARKRAMRRSKAAIVQRLCQELAIGQVQSNAVVPK